MKNICALALVFPLLCAAAPGHKSSWTVGAEREVDNGIYAKLVAVEGGWRLWRFETARGYDCRAIKPAFGRPHPVPSGEGDTFRGVPSWVMINKSIEGNVEWEFQGVYDSTTVVEWKLPGEKFYSYYMPERSESFEKGTGQKQINSFIPLDGKIIDVVIVSYEHPSPLYINRTELKARFDFTGVNHIVAQLEQCEAQRRTG
jgi:hypothetical protein